ncbi:MAG: hypothetical protein M3Y60_07625 [Bacteroidota bacterium]|nr:hypothetical protein [Bacteroidota bacterium]
MKGIVLFTITAVLAAFGVMTLFMSSSVIFDLFNIRASQGNYVSFVVWANFFSGLLFITAAFAFFKRKGWSRVPMLASLVILLVAFAGLLIHISAGGVYETKTIGAMAFRITVNAALLWVIYSLAKTPRPKTFVASGMLLLLSLGLLVASCGKQGGDHDDHAIESGDAHHHDADAGPVQLNNGEKWGADEHTVSVVADMKSELSDFEKVGQEDYDVLADSLTRQLSILVAGCTMTGPAHDELHKWLVPLTENVKNLRLAQDASNVTEIEKNLDAFDHFFELAAD